MRSLKTCIRIGEPLLDFPAPIRALKHAQFLCHIASKAMILEHLAVFGTIWYGWPFSKSIHIYPAEPLRIAFFLASPPEPGQKRPDWNPYPSHPISLEPPGFWLIVAQDCAVQAPLADDGGISLTTYIEYSPFVFTQTFCDIRCVLCISTWDRAAGCRKAYLGFFSLQIKNQALSSKKM